jgi:hypothetical protein
VIAHVGSVPVEELVPMAGSAGVALLFARAWAGRRLRRRGPQNPGA